MSYLHNDTPQSCGSDMQRKTLQSTFNFDLFELVLSNDNLQRAWKQVRANKGAAGEDGMKIDQFLDWAKQHWQQCKTQLENGTYRPQPVKRVEIDKPDGGKRQLGIPTVVDRVIQQAITQVLSPIIDNTFSDTTKAIENKQFILEMLQRSALASKLAAFKQLLSLYSSVNPLNLLEKDERNLSKQ